jgi:hypothetical protein
MICQWFDLKTTWTVSPSITSKPVVAVFLVWPQNQGWRFLGLSLKTMRASVCRLNHKTDGGRMARDTHRDLAASFTWKQVVLGFFNLALRLADE